MAFLEHFGSLFLVETGWDMGQRSFKCFVFVHEHNEVAVKKQKDRIMGFYYKYTRKRAFFKLLFSEY